MRALSRNKADLNRLNRGHTRCRRRSPPGPASGSVPRASGRLTVRAPRRSRNAWRGGVGQVAHATGSPRADLRPRTGNDAS